MTTSTTKRIQKLRQFRNSTNSPSNYGSQQLFNEEVISKINEIINKPSMKVNNIIRRVKELDDKDLNPIMRMTINYILYGKRDEDKLHSNSKVNEK